MVDAGARVVVATRTFPPDSGAAPIRLAAVVRALAGRGADVRVLTTTPAGGSGTPRPEARDGEPGAPAVSRWPVLRDRAGRVRGYLPYLTFDLPLSLRLALVRGVDAVLVEPPPTTGAVVRVIAALRGVPYAYYAADVMTSAAAGAGVRGPALWALRRLESFALRGAAAVLTPSEGMADQLVALGAARERLTVVGTGTDTGVFTPAGADAVAEPPADAPLPPEAPLAVYAGTMSEVHGTEIFIRAFAAAARRVPGARLALVGDGTERARLAGLAERLAPGQVVVTGQLPVEEVARWWRRAWVGLAAMPHYPVAYATKMFAATACGTPVVYAGPGPCAAMVERGGLGWAVPYEVAAVTQALVEALGAPPSAARRARTAAWTQEHASLDSVAARAATAVLGAAVSHRVLARTHPRSAPRASARDDEPRAAALFVASSLTPLRGMERAALEVVERLRADGLDVGVAVLDPGPPAATRAERARRLATSFVAARALVRRAAARDQTLVLVGIWVGLRVLPWVRRGPRRPRVVAWEHSSTRERAARSPGFRAVARTVLPLYASRADAVVAVSAAVADALPGAAAARTAVIANPVALEAGPPAPHRSRRRDPGATATASPVRLLAIGALIPVKAPELALDALEALRAHDVPARLDVAGDGPLRRGLAARARDHGLDVTWHGHVPDVAPLLARADALLHTAASETFGYVLLEAAAAGVPVVAVTTAQARALVPELVPGVTSEPRGNALALGVCGVLERSEETCETDDRRAWEARRTAFDPATLTGAWRALLEPPGRGPHRR